MVKVIPRPFSGQVDLFGNVEDPQAWLDHFEMVSIPNGWNTNVLKIQNFPVYLVGEAASWYTVKRTLINAPGVSWAQVQASIVQRFRPANYNQELERRLHDPSCWNLCTVRMYVQFACNSVS